MQYIEWSAAVFELLNFLAAVAAVTLVKYTSYFCHPKEMFTEVQSRKDRKLFAVLPTVYKQRIIQKENRDERRKKYKQIDLFSFGFSDLSDVKQFTNLIKRPRRKSNN